MKITKNQLKLSKFVSKDAFRPALHSILHDGKKSVVTNGHYLIINESKNAEELPQEPVMLQGKPLQGIKNDCEIEDNVNNSLQLREAITGTVFAIKKGDGKFPDYKQVLPESVTPFFKVDARYLKLICDYVIQCADKGDKPVVTFSLQNEPDCEKYSISIDFEDDEQSIRSILMPVRM